MMEFFQSFSPFFQKYRSEVILITVALIIAIVSGLVFFQNVGQINEEGEVVFNQEPAQKISTRIMVDISGAINKPGVYEATAGSRLKDIINLAGGLNSDADYNFFNRNFNLARFTSDQEKIYIPSVWEINSGIFTENNRSLDYTYPAESLTSTSDSLLININNAQVEELDKLPGIGQVTAKKIIDNRPYKSTEELLTKKIVKKNVWEQIKNTISIN